MEIRNKFFTITDSPDPKYVFMKLSEDGEVLDKENMKLMIQCLQSVNEYLFE